MPASSDLFAKYLNNAINYESYLALIRDLISENRTTGPLQTESLISYTRLNLQRMERWNKTIVMNDELQAVLHTLNKRMIWLVITEAWCGDAAQTVPLMHAIAAASNGMIELKLILRDENLGLMDHYLTHGGRAIPILICLDADSLDELGTWGPRPEEAQRMVMHFKQHPDKSPEAFKTDLHTWYAQNKTRMQQAEMISRLKEWSC